MPVTLTVAPTPDPQRVRLPDGTLASPPAGWALLPPGDAGLTRRVKALGPSWTVEERVGRKRFSRGVWAPAEHLARARAEVSEERADPAYARRLARAAEKRAEDQARYELDFANAVLAHLRFGAAWAQEAKRLAVAVAHHATPVGSGTVARTRRLTLEDKAAHAVTAWLRHQTTDYDDRRIARVRGARREVRRELAHEGKGLLARHRVPERHPPEGCALCTALARLGSASPR